MSDRRLTPELLLGAYAAGVFPMAETRDASEIFWVDPERRGILPLDGFRMSRSLARRMRSGRFRATLDRSFPQVLDGCADRDETWINGTIRDLMLDLHALGPAHSFEVWEGEKLAGGMYGIALGGAFFGESMFSRVTDGSKMVLAAALDHLRRCGFTLFDTQFLTPHLASLGGVEITRAAYRARLARALADRASIDAIAMDGDLQAVVQRMTHTS
ncbi:leucyl/phenylalanyl-tRNA--protein transferase [Silicimonas algicola]|uniref:Leucyl/phenylalanyl-tRNA--protein transferase n=2 Tax=Silicimonas algicola TaxID=1826607 RepID=A0A316G8Y8_9RHOB|nr:leucyl/phenylalanyl-tRNA--protein transferase [Silicimonas algicola]PWK57082.1 leucyl/phenylalanyl-tRNA--protein transferase [Silicimonas algicola]